MADDIARELRAFLAAELPAHRRRWGREDPPSFAQRLAFQRLLAAGGWAAPGWPVEHGGRGLGIAERLACDAVLAQADAPLPLGVLGLANVGPALIEFGTDAQRASLSRILDGTEIWCQGFSEPGAGSDLASLRTTARLTDDGREFVIDGQKVWTSNGMEATHCMLLARTDRTAPRHRGISVLLVPMDAEGVERRPITMISGDQEFAELFFTGVHVPADAVLGPLHDGWQVTTRTLVHERSGVLSRAAGLQRRAHRELARFAHTTDPVLRDELIRRYTEARVLGLLGGRTLAAAEAGRDTSAEQALIKLAWGLADRALAETALNAAGPAVTGEAVRAWLFTRSSTIAAGTTEILKDLVAERVLGLPR